MYTSNQKAWNWRQKVDNLCNKSQLLTWWQVDKSQLACFNTYFPMDYLHRDGDEWCSCGVDNKARWGYIPLINQTHSAGEYYIALRVKSWRLRVTIDGKLFRVNQSTPCHCRQRKRVSGFHHGYWQTGVWRWVGTWRARADICTTPEMNKKR